MKIPSECSVRRLAAVFIGLAVLTAAAAVLVALTDTELARAHR